MFRKLGKLYTKPIFSSHLYQSRSFLTKEYTCAKEWNAHTASQLLQKVNLNDFYNQLEQNYLSKGVISAIDVDIFASNAKQATYLEELKDLLHKLRLSSETGNTMESTHHATVRNFMDYGNVEDLLQILKDPLNFGIFLDNYSANILLDKLLTSESYEMAAEVASLMMLQEEFTNEITCALCQYSCYKYIMSRKPQVVDNPPDSELQQKKKIEEIKIRVKFLRNPYFDDHFDIKDLYLLSGKTLAWISKCSLDNINNNLQLIGWLVYKKYERLLTVCEEFANNTSSKIYSEVIQLFERESSDTKVNEEPKTILDKCILTLSKVGSAEGSLEEAIKIKIENSINSSQVKDVLAQHQLFELWQENRKEKLEEQIQRLDRAKRMQIIEEKHKLMKDEEQKLWFFENEEHIDLEIEAKEKLVDKSQRQRVTKETDEGYIPPEILPKRK